MPEPQAEKDALRVKVTIETLTAETAVIDIDWATFWEWAGNVAPTDLNDKLREFLRAGDEWEVCSRVHESSADAADVVDCWVRKAQITTSATREDYVLDGSPEAVALVREVRGLDPLPVDAPWPREECGNRGPRAGEDGTICRRSKGHEMPHSVAPSDGFGHVTWSDLAPTTPPGNKRPEDSS